MPSVCKFLLTFFGFLAGFLHFIFTFIVRFVLECTKNTRKKFDIPKSPSIIINKFKLHTLYFSTILTFYIMPATIITRRQAFCFVTVFAVIIVLCGNLFADEKTWVGNTDANWQTAGNWYGGVAPATSGDSLVFGAAGSSGTTLTNNFDAGVLSVSGITFTADAPSYTISPNWVALTGGIVNNSVNAQTINLGQELRAAVTINAAAGDINILDGSSINPLTNTLTIDGAKNTTIGLRIGGTASTALIKMALER